MTAQPWESAQSVSLLPCPFCGGEPEIERSGTSRQSCIVICTDCNTKHESPDEGARSGASWNRRVPAPASGWQDERPTEGKWWCSLHPDKRGNAWDKMLPVKVDGGFHDDDQFNTRIREEVLTGALWKRRETPADPFKVGESDSKPAGGHWESKRGEFHGLDSKPGDVWVPGEEFRSGMPSAELRAVHEHWQDNYGHPWRFLPTDEPTAILNKGKFRPWKSTWGAVALKAAASKVSP